MAKQLKLVKESGKGTTIGFIGFGIKGGKVGSTAPCGESADT
ncbi:MAG: hypothetical protein ACM362_15200 [Candidatus Methylomirabilota bacterium]